MTTNIPRLTKPHIIPRLTKPHIVGFMSVDGDRIYHANISQLKYFNKFPEGFFTLDLNHNINAAVKRTTDENDEKISLLLKYLSDRSSLLQNSEFMFVTYRRTLISVMCNIFNPKPLRIIASFFNEAIYLCSIETPEEMKSRHSRTTQEERMCAWGYKFEQYILSDHPKTSPNINRPVIENEEFSLYYSATLGQHSLLYGAQIDGMMATHSTISNPPVTNEEIMLDYLKSNSYLELKTNRHIETNRQERNFRRYKLLRCWCQCYLANLEGLLVGFRNDSGIVSRLQWFSTEDIVSYCKREWNPESMLKHLDNFLSFVKNCVKTEREKGYFNSEPVSLLFKISENNTIHVNKCDSVEVLPKWYIDKILGY